MNHQDRYACAGIAENSRLVGQIKAGVRGRGREVLWQCEHSHTDMIDAYECAVAELELSIGRELMRIVGAEG